MECDIKEKGEKDETSETNQLKEQDNGDPGPLLGTVQLDANTENYLQGGELNSEIPSEETTETILMDDELFNKEKEKAYQMLLRKSGPYAVEMAKIIPDEVMRAFCRTELDRLRKEEQGKIKGTQEKEDNGEKHNNEDGFKRLLQEVNASNEHSECMKCLHHVLQNDAIDLPECKEPHSIDNINFQDTKGYTLLAAACEKNMLNVVLFLLEHEADINLCTISHESPLFLACSKQTANIAVVQALVDHKALLNSQNDKGQTPLHISLINQKEEIADYLIKNKADVSLLDNQGNSAIYLALSQGLCPGLAEFITSSAEEDWIAFRAAIVSCDTNNINKMAATGIDVNFQGLDGKSPLLLFCSGNHDSSEVLKILLDYGADVNARDDLGNSVLHLACFNGLTSTVKELLDHDLSVNDINKDNMTPLMKAVQGNDIDIIELLLNVGADINIKDKSGNTAVHFASSGGRNSIVELFINKGCNINIENDVKKTPLHLGHETSNTVLADTIKKTGQYEDSLTEQFYKASVDNDTDFMKYLISCGADVNTLAYDKSPLHNAYYARSPGAVQCILESGVDVNASDPEDWYLFLAASRDNEIDYIKIMNEICNDIDLSITHESGKNALHYACENNNKELIELLVNLDKEGILVKSDENGESPFHKAVLEGKEDILNALVSGQRPIDINICDNSGQTALFLACMRGYASFVKIIGNIEKVDINLPRYDGLTALHVAANCETVEALLAFAADPKKEDYIGNTPYLTHCQQGRLNCAKVLEDVSDKNHINNMERTALHLFAGNNDTSNEEDIILCSDLNAVDINGQTALHLASSGGRINTLICLLHLDVDHRKEDKCSLRAVHVALNDSIRSELEKVPDIFIDEKANDIYHYRKETESKDILFIKNYFEARSFKAYHTYLHSPLVGFIETIPEQKDEFDEVTETMLNFMKDVSSLVESIDPEMAFDTVMSGSVNEGTKIKRPDEFDFLCVLKEVSKIVKEPQSFTFNPSCVELFAKEKNNYDFVNEKGQLLTFKLFRRFYSSFAKALKSKSLWEKFPRLYRAVSDDITGINEEISNLNFTWRGKVYLLQPISVDIVPAIFFPQWMPRWCENHYHLTEKQGCHVVAKMINYAPDKLKPKLFQLCFSSAEANLIQMMPQDLLDGLKLAKLVKDLFMPSLLMTISSLMQGAQLNDFISLGFAPEVPPKSVNEVFQDVQSYLSSYHLKSCACQIFLENNYRRERYSTTSKLEMSYAMSKQASRIFEKMLESFRLKYLPAPFVRGYNIISNIVNNEIANKALQMYCYFLYHHAQPGGYDFTSYMKETQNLPYIQENICEGLAPHNLQPVVNNVVTKMYGNPNLLMKFINLETRNAEQVGKDMF